MLTDHTGHLPTEQFETRYRAHADPWGFHTEWYEQRRYAVSLASLPDPEYRHGLEVGCANGALTPQLATRCDRLTALDPSPTAIEHARRSCAGLGNVELVVGAAPEDLPDGRFDLVVLSEVGYYFSVEGLQRLLDELAARLDHGGTLLSVHWTGSSADHLLGGAFVETRVRHHPAWRTIVRHTDEQFVLGVHVRPGRVDGGELS